jgi:hypothetical protein
MGDLANTSLSNYTIVWGDEGELDFGFIDKVKLGGKMILKEIKVGSMGDVTLGHRVIGLEPAISIEARETTLAMLQGVHPWWTTGPIGMLPAQLHQDLYAYAQLLRLHPINAGGSATKDRCYLKAVPFLNNSDRDGVNDDKDMIDFLIYPDRDQFPSLVYGYIGNPPA